MNPYFCAMKFLPLLFVLTSTSFVYSQFINGVVYNVETNEVLPQVKIFVKENDYSISTDINGNFSLSTKNLPHTISLVFTSNKFNQYQLKLNRPSSDTTIQVYLEESHVELDEVEIISATGKTVEDVVTAVSIKKIGAWNEIQQTNMGDLLSTIPGVSNLSTGNGTYKPIIRGLSGNRILTLINGVRLENQQFGSDHGLGITELGINQVEVIKGPASLLYGADALGGILYFSDENYSELGAFSVLAQSKFESNSLLSSNTLSIKGSTRKIRFNLYGQYNTASDYQIPSGIRVLNTRFEQKIAKFSIGFGKKNYVSNIRYNLSSSNYGIPADAHHEEEHEHEEEGDHEHNHSYYSSSTSKRKLLPLQYSLNQLISWENKLFLKNQVLSLMFANTHNQLSEFEDSKNVAETGLALNTSSVQLRDEINFSKNYRLMAGFQGFYQINKNNKSAVENLLPNSTTLDNGIYTVFHGKYNKTVFQLGLRGDYRMLTADLDTITYEKNFFGLTYSAGIVQSFGVSKIRFNFSSGYRPAHTSELYSNGIHHGSLRYEIGNTSLSQEQANQLDLSYEFVGEHIEFLVNPFFNHINRYVYLQAEDSIVDEYPVYTYHAANTAIIYGIDAGFHLHPHFAHWLHLESYFSYVRGTYNNNSNLSFIPAPKLFSQLQFNLNLGKTFKFKSIQLNHAYYLPQNRVSIFETKSVDYHLLDLGITLGYTTKYLAIDIVSGVKNVLNSAYIPHTSTMKPFGIYSPGINMYLGVKFSFEKSVH